MALYAGPGWTGPNWAGLHLTRYWVIFIFTARPGRPGSQGRYGEGLDGSSITTLAELGITLGSSTASTATIWKSCTSSNPTNPSTASTGTTWMSCRIVPYPQGSVQHVAKPSWHCHSSHFVGLEAGLHDSCIEGLPTSRYLMPDNTW